MSLKGKIPLPICVGHQQKLVESKFTINEKGRVSILHSKKYIQEMPFYASFLKASYTIEAAVILPLFISFMIFAMFMFRLLQVEYGMQKSIDEASRIMAVTLGNVSNTGESDKDVDSEDEPTIKGELSEAGLLAATIAMASAAVVENDVPLEYIDGGPLGIYFLDSTASGNYIDLKISYRMTYPIGLLGDLSFDVDQRSRNRKWVGYDKLEYETDGTYVYITEHGQAYHTNYYCTYLNPSVHAVKKKDVKESRNKGGEKYSVCRKCKNEPAGSYLYITDYGTAYHNSAECTEIKHNIKKVLLEDVKDSMRPCSKCAAEEKH